MSRGALPLSGRPSGTTTAYLACFSIRGGADCTALPWGNDLYCKLKLKREEEELTTKLKYLNNYSER